VDDDACDQRNRRKAQDESLELDLLRLVTNLLSSKQMRIFGFPVKIRAGFGVFMLLIVFINGVPMGPWLAGSVAVFTLVHELGHALAARRTGAQASISLDFLAGYAAFVPTRHLRRWERAGISIAGPAIQIILGLVVLLVLGVNPLDHDQFAAEYSTFAIWWAGPMIGLFNLIPVLPLDGGNIAAEGLDFLAPGRGRDIMARISIPVTGAAFALMLVSDNLRPLAAFAGVLMVLQLQMYPATRAQVTRRQEGRAETSMLSATSPDSAIGNEALRAESAAWTTGQPGPQVGAFISSPWWRAFARIVGGDEQAGRIIVDDLHDESADRAPWVPPIAASSEHLQLVLEHLPRPLPEPTPKTSMLSAMTLLDVLRRCGLHDEAIRYGTMLYNVQPQIDPAVEVARNLAVTRHPDLALQWLRIAEQVASDNERLRFLIDHCPEFRSLRHRPDYHDIAKSQVSPTTAPSSTEREI